MVSKSYKIEHDFKKSVVTHLKKEGFNCISQPKDMFPDILAWRPFIDGKGDTLVINVQSNLSGTVTNKTVFPFYVSFIECRKDKPLSKKERNIAKSILKEGRCNTFLVAHKKNKKLLFKEIMLEDEKVIMKPINKQLPTYIG